MDVGGGAGYNQYGGVALPMQRVKSQRKISGLNHVPGVGAGGQPGDYSPGYEERTLYCMPHLLDLVCN
jgi:hypothetical protein